MSYFKNNSKRHLQHVGRLKLKFSFIAKSDHKSTKASKMASEAPENPKIGFGVILLLITAIFYLLSYTIITFSSWKNKFVYNIGISVSCGMFIIILVLSPRSKTDDDVVHVSNFEENSTPFASLR